MEAIAPFVVVSLGNQRFETKVVEKEHPVWNQQYNMYVYTTPGVDLLIYALQSYSQ